VEVAGGKLITIEGNTNDGGSREGVGVFLRESRKIAQINKGLSTTARRESLAATTSRRLQASFVAS
jgi:hypothetical protein